MTKLVIWCRFLMAILTSGSNRKFYDNIAPIYDRLFVKHGVHAQRITLILRDRIGDQVNSTRILDLGCGTGLLTRTLDESGFEVIGIDNSNESLVQLRQRNPHIVTIKADAAALPLDDNSVQAVVCLGAWRHFADPHQTMAEISRILTDEGIVIVGYFPAAFGGVIHWTHGFWQRGLSVIYHLITRKLGYWDRADSMLEFEASCLAQIFFSHAFTVESG